MLIQALRSIIWGFRKPLTGVRMLTYKVGKYEKTLLPRPFPRVLTIMGLRPPGHAPRGHYPSAPQLLALLPN